MLIHTLFKKIKPVFVDLYTNNIVRVVLATALTILSVTIIFYPSDFYTSETSYNFIFNFIHVLHNVLKNSIMGNSKLFCIVFPLLYFWYYKYYSKAKAKASISVKISALILSIILMFGIDYLSLGEIISLYNILSYHFIFEVLVFCGIYTFAKSFINRLFEYFDFLQTNPALDTHRLSNRAYFILVFVLMLISWSPYFILQYPGSCPADTMQQVYEHISPEQYNAANPLFLTLIYGQLFLIGRSISDNLGIFLGIAFQAISCALAFSYICLKIRNMNLPKFFSNISLTFYCLTPIWAVFIQCLIKDVPHTAAFSWFLVEFADTLQNDRLKKSGFVKLIISAALVILTRVTGGYLIFVSLLVLFLLKRKSNITAFKILSLVTALIFLFLNPILSMALKAEKHSKTDVFGTMFQMTAHYCRTYSEDITEDDKEIINGALDYNVIVNNYSPTLSDNVKRTFHFEKNAFIKYAGLWTRQLFKHPGTYLTAFINGNIAYWNPLIHFRGVGIDSIDDRFPNTIHYVHSIDKRIVIDNYYNIWKDFPGLSLLYSAGFYFFIVLICLIWLIKIKDRTGLAVLLPVFFVFVGCLFSPVNGDFRYIAPLIATTPFVLSFSVRKRSGE